MTAKMRHCEFEAKNFYIKGQMTMESVIPTE